VTVDQLVRFYRNPARFLLQERLGIRLEESEGLVESREPLVLDALEAYWLRDELLALMQAGRPLAESLRVVRAGGLVPHGQVGEGVLQSQSGGVASMAERLTRLAQGERLPALPVDLEVAGVRLRGSLDGVRRGGRVEFRPADMKAGDWTTLWIRHLVLHLVAPSDVERASWFVARDEELALGPVAAPDTVLADLVCLFREGLEYPLPYLPRSAFAALGANDKLGSARGVWRGSDFWGGEGDEPYFQLAFRGVDPIGDDFLTLVERILGPIRDADRSVS